VENALDINRRRWLIYLSWKEGKSKRLKEGLKNINDNS
jgi:hypothetical protein